MTEAISGDGAAVAPGGAFDEDDDNDAHSMDSRSLDTTDEAPNMANNVRIKSKRFLRDYEVDDDVAPAGDKEDPVDLILMTVNTAISADNAGGTAGGQGGMEKGGAASGGGAGNAAAAAMMDDAKVPSRLAVKKLSSQVSIEARRREEMEVRRKK
jgi:hypothetical protein